jgi:hypothetical protein
VVKFAIVANAIFHLYHSIRDGASQARQVADCFLGVHNLTEARDPVVVHCLKEIRRVQRTQAKSSPSHASYELKRLVRLAHHQVRFEAVIGLHQHHHSHRQIAEELGMTERTVRLASYARMLYEVMQAFAAIVRKCEGEHVDTWLHAVQPSGIPEVIHFAHGLE